MDNTLTIQLTNPKAIGILRELEELHLIKVIKKNNGTANLNLADKYRGIITKEQGENLKEHIKQMRSEWNNI